MHKFTAIQIIILKERKKAEEDVFCLVWRDRGPLLLPLMSICRIAAVHLHAIHTHQTIVGQREPHSAPRMNRALHNGATTLNYVQLNMFPSSATRIMWYLYEEYRKVYAHQGAIYLHKRVWLVQFNIKGFAYIIFCFFPHRSSIDPKISIWLRAKQIHLKACDDKMG